MFGPLRTLGVPEPVIDVVEPFFRVLVELGYDRSIPAWEPTPARLIPPLDPAKVVTDLVNAIGEGINNAAALIGAPPLLSIPAPVTPAAPATETAKADISHQVTATDTATQTEQVTSTGTAVANMVPAAGPPESTATQKPADPASVTETGQADVSPQVTPTETVTETSHVTSTEKVTETTKANEASTGPRATPNPSVSACHARAGEACRSAGDASARGARFAWGGRAAARSAAPRQWRPPDHPDLRCRRQGGDGRTILGRINVSRFVLDRQRLLRRFLTDRFNGRLCRAGWRLLVVSCSRRVPPCAFARESSVDPSNILALSFYSVSKRRAPSVVILSGSPPLT